MQIEEGRVEEEVYEEETSEDEMYEDSFQVKGDAVSSQEPKEEQEMYELPSDLAAVSDPAIHATVSPLRSQALSMVPTLSSAKSDEGYMYMDPTAVRDAISDDTVPTDAIVRDWSSAYDPSFKRGEKAHPGELKDVLKKGWLEKLGGRNLKRWQKRFCALCSVFMYVYEREYSRTYNERITVPGHVVNLAPDLTHPKKKQFAFKLTSMDESGLGKDYYFRTTSFFNREEWIITLEAACEIGQIGKPATSTCTEEGAKRLGFIVPRMPSQWQAILASVWQSQRSSDVGEQENHETLETLMGTESQEKCVDASQRKISCKPLLLALFCGWGVKGSNI